MTVSARDVEVCQNKKVYNTLLLAKRMANGINWAYPNQPKQRPYKCRVCGKYHLTCGASNIEGVV